MEFSEKTINGEIARLREALSANIPDNVSFILNGVIRLVMHPEFFIPLDLSEEWITIPIPHDLNFEPAWSASARFRYFKIEIQLTGDPNLHWTTPNVIVNRDHISGVTRKGHTYDFVLKKQKCFLGGTYEDYSKGYVFGPKLIRNMYRVGSGLWRPDLWMSVADDMDMLCRPICEMTNYSSGLVRQKISDLMVSDAEPNSREYLSAVIDILSMIREDLQS